MDLNRGSCESTFSYRVKCISYHGISVLGRSGVYDFMENVVQCNMVETENRVCRLRETRHKIRVAWYEDNKRERQTGKRTRLMHSDESIT
jgi:hypothetical protein